MNLCSYILAACIILSGIGSGAAEISADNGSPPNPVSYAIVHLSDTQNLATSYHDTYNLTFSYLEEIKDSYNISAIIITGDLVNTWNKLSEWNAYQDAVNHTSIPVFTIAGNHDSARGKNSWYYSKYTGYHNFTDIIPLPGLNLVQINYVKSTLLKDEFSQIRKKLTESDLPFTIIATHYYMNADRTLSTLGKDIDKELIVGPTLILAGHKYLNYQNVTTIHSFPVIRDITNYQQISHDGVTTKNYSAGILYNVTMQDGTITQITSQKLHIYPEEKISDPILVYQANHP